MGNLGSVHCPKHGEKRPASVCQHLVRGSGRGFFTPNRPPTEEESAEQAAWCSDCERVRQDERGWNDVSEGYAGVTMICAACFEAARRRNELGKESRPF